MTYEDVALATLARTMEWDAEFPSTRLPMFRRIGTRQQQLFSIASKLNPEYFGRCATGDLDASGCLDLRDLATAAAPVDQAAGIQHIEVNDPGTGVHATGTEVTVVSIADHDAEVVPRATVRDFVIRGVDLDLEGVVSLDVYYPRVSDMPAVGEDGTTDLELLEQHQELLVIDLTKDLIRKTLDMGPEPKAAVTAILEGEEATLMANYLEDIRGFAIEQAHRFSEPIPTATR